MNEVKVDRQSINESKSGSPLDFYLKNTKNTKNKTCSFHAIYNDLENNSRFTDWRCKERTEKSNIYCVFHDKTNNHWDDKTNKRFFEMVKHSIINQDPLFCIGYYFPDNFSFTLLDIPPDQHENIKKFKQTYNMLIYLCDAEFEGQVEFSYCIFKKKLNLSGANFKREVLFRWAVFEDEFYSRNTKFYDNVNFRNAQFKNANFHDTLFKDKANFHDAIFIGDDTRFLDVQFKDKANFKNTKFYGETIFTGTSFREAQFDKDVEFKDSIKFWNVVFENGENVIFDTRNLTNVSFLNTDNTRIKFSEDVNWGGYNNITIKDERDLILKYKLELTSKYKPLFIWEKVLSDDKHKKRIIDFIQAKFALCVLENNFEKSKDGKVIIVKSKNSSRYNDASKEEIREIFHIELDDEQRIAILRIYNKSYKFFVIKVKGNETRIYFKYPDIDSIKAIYRNLRENYEYRLRYDEAGQFFVQEMELKRKYRKYISKYRQPVVTQNNFFRKHFSLTGWYYHLSRYGEDLLRPTLAGLIILLISTLFWTTQSRPALEPNFNFTNISPSDITEDSSTFILFKNITNHEHWIKSFERSIADFLPLLSLDNDIKVGIIDYIIKIVGGAVTFGLIAIALRRKFERKFRH